MLQSLNKELDIDECMKAAVFNVTSDKCKMNRYRGGCKTAELFGGLGLVKGDYIQAVGEY